MNFTALYCTVLHCLPSPCVEWQPIPCHNRGGDSQSWRRRQKRSRRRRRRTQSRGLRKSNKGRRMRRWQKRSRRRSSGSSKNSNRGKWNSRRTLEVWEFNNGDYYLIQYLLITPRKTMAKTTQTIAFAKHFSISAFQLFSISAFQHFSISAFQYFSISS